jgi:cephalosporin-C deacetylase-like acetyl esterase
MKKLILLPTLLLSASVICITQESYPQMVRHFEYNRSAPLDLKEIGIENRNGIKVHDISYTSPVGGSVPAYLVVPDGKGPFAAIIFGHWAMKGSPARNRTEFLEEALVLARAGAISLLINSADIRPGVIEDEDFLSKKNTDLVLQQALDLRRGVDLLLARKDVDPKRLAYVGHSYNAGVGSILAGVEKRIKAFVLMAGGVSDAEIFRSDEPEIVAWRKSVGEKRVEEYMQNYAWLDAGNFVGHATPAAVLLQYARNDGLLNEKRERYFFSLVSEPKTLRLYDATHALNAEARWDRFEWLREQLRLKPLPRAVLDRVPQVK